MFQPILKWLFYRSLSASQADSKRVKKVSNIHSAKSIGILYDASVADKNVLVTAFAEKLKTKVAQVKSLGFVNDTKTTGSAAVPLFNKKNLTFMQRPQGAEVEAFIKENFDILIYAETSENIPLEYICAHSSSGFKMGPYFENGEGCFDLMINLNEKTELSNYLEQINFYLNNLNNGKS